MRKAEQQEINKMCEKEFNTAIEQFNKEWHSSYSLTGAKRLRSCTAWVYETENYFILRSYNTLIACINKTTDTLFDVLRTEYGYTATSAKHISKFDTDYGQDKWGCHNRYISR